MRKEKTGIQESLAELEDCLETPIVPGELPGWAEKVQAAGRTMQSRLERYLEKAHPAEFAEMAEQDPALAPRIEQMRAEDAALSRELDRFVEDAGRFNDAARQIEPDEAAIEQVRARFVDDGLGLVLRIRKQEAAVRTWYVEAFQRDRGVVD